MRVGILQKFRNREVAVWGRAGDKRRRYDLPQLKEASA